MCCVCVYVIYLLISLLKFIFILSCWMNEWLISTRMCIFNSFAAKIGDVELWSIFLSLISGRAWQSRARFLVFWCETNTLYLLPTDRITFSFHFILHVYMYENTGTSDALKYVFVHILQYKWKVQQTVCCNRISTECVPRISILRAMFVKLASFCHPCSYHLQPFVTLQPFVPFCWIFTETYWYFCRAWLQTVYG